MLCDSLSFVHKTGSRMEMGFCFNFWYSRSFNFSQKGKESILYLVLVCTGYFPPDFAISWVHAHWGAGEHAAGIGSLYHWVLQTNILPLGTLFVCQSSPLTAVGEPGVWKADGLVFSPCVLGGECGWVRAHTHCGDPQFCPSFLPSFLLTEDPR